MSDPDRMLRLEHDIEAALVASITAWLDRVRTEVLPALTAAAEEPAPVEEPGGIPPDVAALVVAGAVLWETEVDGVFLPTFAGLLGDLAAVELGAGRTRVEVDQFGAGETGSDQMREWIGQHTAQVRDRLLGAPAAAARAAQAAVDEAGPNVPAQRAAVRRELTEPGSRMWAGFAARVARTEAAAGFNGIRVAAARIRDRAAAVFNRLRGRSGSSDERPRLVKRWVCVTGDTRVRAQDVSHIARRHHEGAVIRIRTASGAVLTTTPEHRVLTHRGWIPAEGLKVGDCLIHIAGGNSTGAPDVENLPPRIDEVFDAAVAALPVEMRSVPVGVDLNSDIVDGQIEVVSPDRDLAAYLIPSFGQSGVGEGLPSADVLAERLLLAQGSLRDLRGGLSTAGDGGGCCPDADTRRVRITGDAKVPGLAAPANMDSGVAEDAGDSWPAYAQRLPDHTDGIASDIPGYDIVGECGAFLGAECGRRSAGHVDRSGHSGSLRRATGDAVSFQQPGNRLVGTAGDLGDLGTGSSLVVELDDVVGIEVEAFSGHVYDLTTSCGWFEANCLVIHNCNHDDRVRHSHLDADGQRVELGEDFLVGGFPLAFPGDPLGPPAETYNCRCFVVVDEVAADQAARVASAVLPGGTRMKTFRANIIPLGQFGRSQGWMLGSTVELVDTVLPQAMKWQKTADPAHTGAHTVAAIESIAVEDGWLVGYGTWLDTPEAAQAAAEVEAGVTRPSVELVGRTEVMTDADGNPIPMETAEALAMDGERIGFRIDVAEIVATTLVSVPEFRDASITFADAAPDHAAPALVAAATLVEDSYDAALFERPELGEPVPIHLTSEGRVVGYLATWDTPHIGHQGRNVRPYRTHSGYAEFHQSSVLLASGERLRVGRLTVGGGHARPGVGMQAAVEHYDNVGTCWAFVRAYEDEIGIVVSGVLNAAADETMVRQALGTPHSGHWERVGGHPELIAACAVNTPGFPIIQRACDRDGDLGMVASFAPRWPGNRIDTALLDEVAERAAAAALRGLAEQQQEQVRVAAARQMIGAHRGRVLAEVIRANHAARKVGA